MYEPNERRSQLLERALALPRPPIGLCFVAAKPEGVPEHERGAPSACTFWRRAHDGVFYAPASAHLACPLGAITMGFPLGEEDVARAGELVELMAGMGYLAPEEPALLPKVERGQTGIVYGPLDQLPGEPDVVLLEVTPYQAMLVSEATGAACLGSDQPLAAMGRPACAALAFAVNTARTTLSLGCMGARTYTGIPESSLLLAVAAASLDRMVERLPALLEANQVLGRLHAEKRAAAT